MKHTYTGDMQEKEKAEVRQRAEKTRQGREREGKERREKIKSLYLWMKKVRLTH